MTGRNNPWRHGAFFECVAKLEKSGIERPRAFDLIEEILDAIQRVEQEDARLERVRKASEAFRQKH